MKRTRTVRSWDELIKLIEQTNPHRETIIMSGYWNRLVGNKLKIERLVFTTVPVEILSGISDDEDGYNITIPIVSRKKRVKKNGKDDE